MITCPYCQAWVCDESRFCDQCGKPLPITILQTMKELQDSRKYEIWVSGLIGAAIAVFLNKVLASPTTNIDWCGLVRYSEGCVLKPVMDGIVAIVFFITLSMAATMLAVPKLLRLA